MQRSKRFLFFLLAVAALFFAAASESLAARVSADAGRIMIKHSPALGLNVGIVVTIDGRHAGHFTRGHIFQRYLSPGRHVIGIYPQGGVWGSSENLVRVGPGQTQLYIAKYKTHRLVIVPVRSFR